MKYELVDREHAHGEIDGSYYGSSATIVARSPTHILFNALGSRIWQRGQSAWHGETKLTRNRPTQKTFADSDIQAKIDAVFGEGAGAIVYEAYRNKKTVLFDGGGTKLPQPRLLLAKKNADWYDSVTINWHDEYATDKTCLQCAARLRPHAMRHHMGDVIQENHPRTVEDCQRLSNHKVVAIYDYGSSMSDSKVGFIKYFETWDGEALVDPHFCNDKCMAKYGRRAAQAGLVLEPGIEPVVVDRHRYEYQNHYETPEKFMDGPNGEKLAI